MSFSELQFRMFSEREGPSSLPPEEPLCSRTIGTGCCARQLFLECNRLGCCFSSTRGTFFIHLHWPFISNDCKMKLINFDQQASARTASTVRARVWQKISNSVPLSRRRRYSWLKNRPTRNRTTDTTGANVWKLNFTE